MKTTELIGPALDWAVAQALFGEGKRVYKNRAAHWIDGLDQKLWTPSTDWSQGGPIIEREEIGVTICGTGEYKWGAVGNGNDGYGPTLLIAAMRCYSSKLGDEIEIPEELK